MKESPKEARYLRNEKGETKY